jgi:hypothetical protein
MKIICVRKLNSLLFSINRLREKYRSAQNPPLQKTFSSLQSLFTLGIIRKANKFCKLHAELRFITAGDT